MKWFSELFYSQSSYRILNLFTLSISDETIKRGYDNFRTRRTNALAIPIGLIVTLMVIVAWILALSGKTTINYPLRNTVHNWFIPCWLLTKYFRPNWTHFLIFLWFLY